MMFAIFEGDMKSTGKRPYTLIHVGESKNDAIEILAQQKSKSLAIVEFCCVGQLNKFMDLFCEYIDLGPIIGRTINPQPLWKHSWNGPPTLQKLLRDYEKNREI